jgi:hypothetical protein
MSDQHITSGQRWVSKDRRDSGRVVVVEQVQQDTTNGYVAVRTEATGRPSMLRQAVLRRYYRLIEEATHA